MANWEQVSQSIENLTPDVYTCNEYTHAMGAMRTNIDIDDKLMKRAMRAAGTSTKRETVEKALETLIRIEGQRSIRRLRGKYKWDGDLDAMRRSE
jgi:Arc/MetJ family transcription regulator